MTDTPVPDIRELARRTMRQAVHLDVNANCDGCNDAADAVLAAVEPVIEERAAKKERAKLTPPLDAFEADLLFEQPGAFAAFLDARERRIRRQVAEEIALHLETDADDEALRPGTRDYASKIVEMWLRESAAIARSHSTQPIEEETTNDAG